MAGKHEHPGVRVWRKLTFSLPGRRHGPKALRVAKPMILLLWDRVARLLRRRALRWPLIATGVLTGAGLLIFFGLWWRLGSGPLEIDIATPWLTRAIEENFGSSYKVAVGGTQLERDRKGHIRLRLRDIVVRDADGAIAASAPKAEVGFSGTRLLTGNMHAERLNLVGAEMSVRIDPAGNVSVFAGNDKHPIASAPASANLPLRAPASAPQQAGTSADQAPGESALENVAAVLAWIDSLGASGLDGHSLSELGLKNGSLVVDDQRNGQHWAFENIHLSLMRSENGGVVFSVASESNDRPWALSAAAVPSRAGRRVFNIEARRVSAKDLLLAARFGSGPMIDQLPISASLHAEIDASDAVQVLQGRVIIEGGVIQDAKDPDIALKIDRAEFTLDWDAVRHRLAIPFQIVSGAARMTLFAQLMAPQSGNGPWLVAMNGGTVVLGGGGSDEPVVFNHVAVRGRIDPEKRLVTIEQGDLGNADTTVALTGSFDVSSSDPRLAIGVAGTRMTLQTMKKLWPNFVNPPLRKWIEEHTASGTVDRVVIATNAPLSAFKTGGDPVPEGGLSVDVSAHDAVIRPIDTLPPIRGADLTVHATGRVATIAMQKGTVTLPSGRKLTMSNGIFEVPKTYGPAPAARSRFQIEGPIPAGGELLAMDRLRQFSALPFDPSTARGNVKATVDLAFRLDPKLPVGSTTYNVTADLADFAADQVFMAQKLEAASLRITASNAESEIKGDVKIAGMPAVLTYRKEKDKPDAEVHLATVLDDAARAKFGMDLGDAIGGPVPLKLSGLMGASSQDSRFNVDLDLTQARIDNLLPGWNKAAGKTAHATFALVSDSQGARLNDLVLTGAGAHAKGNVELDRSGNIVAANFPTFNLAEGDKATLKADRTPDGTLHVSMRGEIYDGRGFVKTAMAGTRADTKGKVSNLDLDIRLGAVLGFNGETLRVLELKMSRHEGQIRNFKLSAKLGRDAVLSGSLRYRTSGRPLIYFETGDAGALFRFTDTYARMAGGQMSVAMDAPSSNPAPQDGILSIKDFSIRGEAALERLVAGAPNGAQQGVKFSRMRAQFTRMPGQLQIHDGVVQGLIGATIDGHINYDADEVHLSGSFVPLYQLNNVFGQIPIVGFFLGGSNEGLLGVTYEVVGRPSAPRLNVNPLSAVAPGLLRKFFEFRNTKDSDFEVLR